MTNTREKLLEAKYFLNRNIEEQSKHEYFIYNLSAFLSAARSITFIMQEEYSKVSGFERWYGEKQTKMQGDSEMKLLNGKRVMTIHQKPVRPRVNTAVNVTLNIPAPSIGYSVEVIGADGTIIEQRKSKLEPSSSPAKAKVTTEWRWYFDDFLDKDVGTVCKEHVGKLEALVEECESRFA